MTADWLSRNHRPAPFRSAAPTLPDRYLYRCADGSAVALCPACARARRARGEALEVGPATERECADCEARCTS